MRCQVPIQLLVLWVGVRLRHCARYNAGLFTSYRKVQLHPLLTPMRLTRMTAAYRFVSDELAMP